ncbi:MAG: MnhB domain-containing protein [Pseudomonadales bacterium]|jgi:multisubunit Na+/H+ antiporter MnhB subunit|nr:MnhB domain-containing protein [Pseudomonadales bacterium]
MKSSPILRAFSAPLLVVLALVSLLVLLRGHNEPGGGFIAGLLMAAAFAFHGLAHGPEAMLRALRVRPFTLSGTGMLMALGAALSGIFAGGALLEGLWFPFTVPGVGKVGNVLVFDIGVFLVVLGSSLGIILRLWSEVESDTPPSMEDLS